MTRWSRGPGRPFQAPDMVRCTHAPIESRGIEMSAPQTAALGSSHVLRCENEPFRPAILHLMSVLPEQYDDTRVAFPASVLVSTRFPSLRTDFVRAACRSWRGRGRRGAQAAPASRGPSLCHTIWMRLAGTTIEVPQTSTAVVYTPTDVDGGCPGTSRIILYGGRAGGSVPSNRTFGLKVPDVSMFMRFDCTRPGPPGRECPPSGRPLRSLVRPPGNGTIGGAGAAQRTPGRSLCDTDHIGVGDGHREACGRLQRSAATPRGSDAATRPAKAEGSERDRPHRGTRRCGTRSGGGGL